MDLKDWVGEHHDKRIAQLEEIKWETTHNRNTFLKRLDVFEKNAERNAKFNGRLGSPGCVRHSRPWTVVAAGGSVFREDEAAIPNTCVCVDKVAKHLNPKVVISIDPLFPAHELRHVVRGTELWATWFTNPEIVENWPGPVWFFGLADTLGTQDYFSEKYFPVDTTVAARHNVGNTLLELLVKGLNAKAITLFGYDFCFEGVDMYGDGSYVVDGIQTISIGEGFRTVDSLVLYYLGFQRILKENPQVQWGVGRECEAAISRVREWSKTWHRA